ncbi:MAG TPA: HEAT repeat domain-containing protein [Polyangiales bacterium]|nr:HEAT repeat domain-containing protein [Polyangiales bacterium]
MKPRSTDASPDPEQARLAEVARLAAAREQGVPGLVALLDHGSWRVRREVIAALAAAGQDALVALCHALQHERSNETAIAATVDALAAFDGDAESALFALADSSNPAVAADVAQILGRRRNPRSVPTLIALLRHADDNVAVAAIEALGRAGGRAAVDALVEAVERNYFFRTYPAIDVLGRSGDPRAVAPLARLLNKPPYAHEASRALGRSADKSAVGPLSALLASPSDATVRVASLALAELLDGHRERYGSAAPVRDALTQQAPESAWRRVSRALEGADTSERVALCAVLGALQNDAVAPVLARMLDAVPAVARAAADALKQLPGGGSDELRAALAEGDSARRQVLLPLLPSSGRTAELVRCLEDPDAGVRALACVALARMGDATVVNALARLLEDDNPRVVQAAIGAIQSLGSADTAALALQAARSPSAGARRAGLRILSYFGYASALDVFIAATKDSDPRVRDVAISGLAFIEHPRALEVLLAAADDGSEKIRAAAMRGLGQSRADIRVTTALRRRLADRDAWVRYYACQAAGKLRAHELAQALAELLSDSAGQVRVAAVEALSQLTGGPALSALSAAAGSGESDVQRAALIGLGLMQSSESLPVLIAACAAPEAATRLVALSALSAFKSPETLAVVVHAIDDADEGVKVAAIELLAIWPGSEATASLVAAMTQGGRHGDVRARIARALAQPTPGRVAGLLSALETADDDLAPALIAALGRVDPDDATSALFDALRLPNAAARKAAAGMLAARGTREALAALAQLADRDPSEEVRRICALLLAQ